MIFPSANCLVRSHNPTLGQRVLDVAQTEREPKIQPDRLTNDLGREAIADITEFGRLDWLICFGKSRKPGA